MLTKKLIKYSTRKGVFHPHKVAANAKDAPVFQEAAEVMARLTTSQQGGELPTAEMIEKGFDAHFTYPDKMRQGIKKLLLDRCAFVKAEDATSFRKQVFDAAAEMRQSYQGSLEQWPTQVAAALHLDTKTLHQNLFADLPQFQRLESFKAVDGDGLRQIYNLSQLQGAMLLATDVCFLLEKPAAAQLRAFLRIIRFRGLLMELEPYGEDGIAMRLSGALSQFAANNPYAARIAMVVPHVLRFPRFTIQATIKTPKGDMELSVLPKSGYELPEHLVPSTHIPEDIAGLIERFQQKESNWQMQPGGELINLTQAQYSCPDFSLTHQDGRRLHLEIFHKWHGYQLGQRLEQLKECSWCVDGAQQPNYLIAAQDSLLKDQRIKTLLEQQQNSGAPVISFRSLPTVTQLRKLLSSLG